MKFCYSIETFGRRKIFGENDKESKKVQNFEVPTMFSQGDDEKMEDLWLKLLQNHEVIRQGNMVAVNYNL